MRSRTTGSSNSVVSTTILATILVDGRSAIVGGVGVGVLLLL